MGYDSITRLLPTGVPGLDSILGGGVPEYSFNLIVGEPGTGKTTLAHQMMFAMATPERRALYFTLLGEPPIKMLRYQQGFSYFDPSRIPGTLRFINLGDQVATGSYDQVLQEILKEMETFSPGLVFIDSFRSLMVEGERGGPAHLGQQAFLQKLGMHLSSWQATTFLMGEEQQETHPVFTVADGILSLCQNVYRNSMVRMLQVRKMRGQATRPGVHTFRLNGDGIEVFPAACLPGEAKGAPVDGGALRPRVRLSLGVPGLDAMMGGGLPAGYSLLVAGPSGSGKTILATAFLVEGVRLGEKGVIVAFEQTPSQSWNPTIHDLVAAGKIGLINTRTLDLSIDEIVQRLLALIHELKATRVVIDSLSGFELAVAPTFREDFRESLFRMVTVLSGTGVTVLLTSELEDRYTDLRFSSYGSAFLTDAIIVQRYIEVKSRLKRLMAVVKLRGSAHSNELREYGIADEGIILGERMRDYEGLLGGQPALKGRRRKPGRRRTP